MPRKIAPYLVEFIEAERARRFVSLSDVGYRQYRALLSVARAVEREGVPTCGCGPCRAMVRLRRLSNPPPLEGRRER